MEKFIKSIELDNLISKYQTPLIVYDQIRMEENLKSYIDSFKSANFTTEIAFASKALSIKEMYRLCMKHQISIDTVSIGEIHTALSVGFDPQKIYFHGNNKTRSDLEYVVEKGIGYIIVDNYDELTRLGEVAKSFGKTVNILIRVNPIVETVDENHKYIQTANLDSKFGVLVNQQLYDKVAELSMTNLCFKGIHCHVGSQITKQEFFNQSIETMAEIAQAIYTNTQVDIEVLNIGGGYGQDCDACAILKQNIVLLEQILKDNPANIQKVVIEPGRSIVNNFAVTLYQVGSVKHPTTFDIVSVDGSMADNIRPALYQAKYEAVNLSNPSGPIVSTRLVGRCCESGDVLIEMCQLNQARVNDVIGVLKTGAYTYSMAMNYNKLSKPAIVFVSDKPKLVVKRETLDDLIKNEL
ncbi:MAG: diaminopimelate decarboxylase [Mycoplasmatales bacterium]